MDSWLPPREREFQMGRNSDKKKKKKLTEQNPQLLTEMLPQLKILAEIKGMTTHSSILAWRTPWIEEPGRL